MIAKIFCGCALFALAAASASAQTKTTISGTCAKPDAVQTMPAGDEPSHIFAIASGKCAVKGETAGAMAQSGTFAEHRDVNANRIRAWGVFTETYDNGDKIFYRYQLVVPLKDGAMQAGKGTYQALSGTGKMKGIKAEGQCAYTPGAGDSISYSCDGAYTLGGAPEAK